MKLIPILAAVALVANVTSCQSAALQKAQIGLAVLGERYEEKTGLTPLQSAGFLTSWWSEIQATRAANKAAKEALAQEAAAAEILRTQAQPVDEDWTSAKQVLEGIQPQASTAPPARPHDPPPPSDRPSIRDAPLLMAHN